jgi:hypothetical protein
MIDALIAGERDTTVLAEMAKGLWVPETQTWLLSRAEPHRS